MASATEAIKNLKFRRKSMERSFQDVRGDMHDAAMWIAPERGRSLDVGRNADAIKRRLLIDSTPRKAFRTIKAGLMGGLSSPARPWFKLNLSGFEQPTHEIKLWLDECQRRMYEVLKYSNAYHALSHCYADLALFGVYTGVISSSYENIIHIQSFPVGSALIAEDTEGKVDTLHWQLKMTVRDMVRRFGIEAVSQRVKNLWDNNQLNDQIEVMAAIEPRLDHDPMRPSFAKNMPVGVYYWEKNSNDKFLHEGGLQIDGIIAPRWETVVDDPWPITSPGRDAVGDVKQLQTQHLDKDTSVQVMYKPPLMGPALGARFNYHPGAYNPMQISNLRDGGPRPVFEARPDIGALQQGIAETQGRVMEAFFADLFRMTSEYGVIGGKDVTAYAIAEMKEEKLIVLGPVLESLDRGLLSPLVQATFHYAQEAGILPPPPDGIEGVPVNVEFTSVLAQAQRSIGISSMERTIGFVATVANFDPAAVDNIDSDGMIREFADQAGTPAVALRSPEAMQAIREDRASQMQQQQMIEAAAPLAQAANLFSEANERGQMGLQEAGII